jgi:outer membrane protein assembly factor BamB
MARYRCLLGCLFALMSGASGLAMAQTFAEPAWVLVKLPAGAEKATVTFGSHVTTSTGLERWYVTPPLTAGKAYSYEVTAAWKVGATEFKFTEKASVAAGKKATVDFTKAVAKEDDTKITAGTDWPQWLGPSRDGSTKEVVLPWKGELKKVWNHPVGDGHSSPVVADGRAYIHYALAGQEIERIDAVDIANGKLAWHFEYPRPMFKTIFGRGPAATPAVAGGKLYAFGATGILTCVDAKTGTKVWQIDTRKMFQTPELKFGVATSPLVSGDLVLVNVGGKGASVVAFNKDTGDVVWKNLDDGASYSSPILFAKGKQVVFLTQKGVVSLTLDKGALLERFPFQDKLAESSTTPVKIGGKLLVSSITLGTALIELGNQKPVWLNPALTSYFTTPAVVGKTHIYLVTGALAFNPSATLHCVDAQSGKSLWQKEKVGKYHACLMRTGDNKLLMVEEAGNLVLIDPDPAQYRELCRSKICGADTWAHPALASGKLYIRDDKQLICVQVGE